MNDFIVVKHAKGAPGLRLAGLGPNFIPQRALKKLIKLFDNNTSWAKGRSKKEVKTMLSHSKVIVSLWNKNKLIGFGRATTDESFRAVLWDIVIDHNYHKKGLGKLVVNSLLKHRAIYKVEKIYIITTFCNDFYSKMGFISSKNQKLMVIEL
tara:strand:- start:32 stop:487 length:456 start_codon:yes stop_codon:yes gene_type:complete